MCCGLENGPIIDVPVYSVSKKIDEDYTSQVMLKLFSRPIQQTEDGGSVQIAVTPLNRHCADGSDCLEFII